MKFFLNNPLKTLFVWAVLYRVFVIVFYQHITTQLDSDGYIELAKLISDFSLSGYNGMRSPGYPLLLSVLNTNVTLLIAVQLFIGVVNSLFVFQNLRLLRFSVRSSLLIAIFLDGFLHVVFYETSVLTESFTLFFITLIINVMLKNYFTEKSIKRDFLMGFLVAYLVFIKPFYIFLPFLIYGFFMLKNFRLQSLGSSKIIILLFPLVTFLGWSYVNKMNTGYFVPTTLQGFYISQNCVNFAEKTTPKYKVISEIYVSHREKTIRENGNLAMSVWSAYTDLEKATGLSFADLSFELNEYSKELIKNNPSDYLKQVSVSWYDFWRTAIMWNETQFKIKESAPAFIWVWNIQHYLLRFLKIAFLVNLLFLGISFLKNRIISPEVIITTIIIATSLLQAFSTYGTNTRFSYPFETLMIMVVLLQLKKLYAHFSLKK